MSGFVVFLQQAYETMKVNSVFTILTIVVGVAQRPRLVWVKVCVASYSRPWKVGMGQEAPLAIEGWAVSVETWSKDDGDVHVFLAPLQLAVGHSLKAQWRHALPHVEGSPNGVVGLLSTHFGCHVLYAAEMWDKRQGVKKLDWRNARRPDHFLFIIKPQIWISLSAVKMSKSIVNWSNKELTALGKINTLKSGLLCWMTTQRKKKKEKIKEQNQIREENKVLWIWDMARQKLTVSSSTTAERGEHRCMSIYVISLRQTRRGKNPTITTFPCTLPFHARPARQQRAKWSDLWEKTAESSPAGFESVQVWRGWDNFLPLEFIF